MGTVKGVQIITYEDESGKQHGTVNHYFIKSNFRGGYNLTLAPSSAQYAEKVLFSGSMLECIEKITDIVTGNGHKNGSNSKGNSG